MKSVVIYTIPVSYTHLDVYKRQLQYEYAADAEPGELVGGRGAAGRDEPRPRGAGRGAADRDGSRPRGAGRHGAGWNESRCRGTGRHGAVRSESWPGDSGMVLPELRHTQLR